MLAAAADHAHGLLAVGRNRGVVVEQLGVAEDAVQWRADLVADAGDVTALGLVGLLGGLAGFLGDLARLLQLGVGLVVQRDFAREQAGLAVRFFLRHAPAFAGEHQPPRDDARRQQQRRKHLDEGQAQLRQQRRIGGRQHRLFVIVDQPQQRAQEQHRDDHQQQVVSEAVAQVAPGRLRQHSAHRLLPLGRHARVRLAGIVAARIEAAAQRADRTLVGRAVRHVLGFVFLFADHAGAGMDVGRRARNVVLAARGQRDQWRGDKSGHQRDEGGKRLRLHAEGAHERGHRQDRRQYHRTHAHRVDVVQVGAAELDAPGAQAQRLVDHQVGHHGGNPRDGDVRVQAQHLVQRLEYVELHQEHGDQRVEHGPHHATRVAVREARKKIRPRQRTGIGVGHVDLDLRDHHQHGGGQQRQLRMVEHQPETVQVHMGGIDRFLERHGGADGQERQQRAAEHLGDAEQDPARAGDQHAEVPAPPVLGRFGRHEAQEIDLLADLRDQRHAHRRGGAESQHVEVAVLAIATGVVEQLRQQFGLLVQDGDERQRHQDQPHRLRQHLDAADQGHAVGHQRNHHQCADHVAEVERQAEIQFQRVGHDGRLQREQDERERRIDERRDGGTDVAEAGATGEQIHVHAIVGGVVADRQAGGEDDQAHGQDRPQRVDEAVVDGDGAADGFQHQERDGAERRVRDAEHRPATERTRRVAQCVVLDGLAGHPGIVVAADLDDALGGFRAWFCLACSHAELSSKKRT